MRKCGALAQGNPACAVISLIKALGRANGTSLAKYSELYFEPTKWKKHQYITSSLLAKIRLLIVL